MTVYSYSKKKNLTAYIIAIFLLLFLVDAKANSSWIKVIQSDKGQSFYVDLESLRESNGLVYFWGINRLQKKG